MSRSNRRKGEQPERRSLPRFTLTTKTDPMADLSLAETFSDLELEFFRQGDALERAEPPVQADAGDSGWGLPVPDPAA
jgi:hypothetical protein